MACRETWQALKEHYPLVRMPTMDVHHYTRTSSEANNTPNTRIHCVQCVVPL